MVLLRRRISTLRTAQLLTRGHRSVVAGEVADVRMCTWHIAIHDACVYTPSEPILIQQPGVVGCVLSAGSCEAL
jgi:hypothetical protein